MANTLPFFPLYAADFLTDEVVALVPNDGVGIYIKLLCRQWIEGSLPSCTGDLSRLAGEDEDSFCLLWDLLEHKFPAGEDGRLRNPRLAAERAKAESIYERKSNGGKARKAQKQESSTEYSQESYQESSPESPQESSKTPPCVSECDVFVPAEGGAGGNSTSWKKWQHWARHIIDEYPKPGPRDKAMDAACRLIDKISQEQGTSTVDEAVAAAVKVTKRFAAATEGAGYIPHLKTWVDDGWWKMDDEEWESYGRDFKDQKKQDSQKRQDRASVAARQERQAEAEADEKARQEASEAKQRATDLVAQLEADYPARLESLVNRAHERWPVLAGRPASSQMVARAVAQLAKEDGDASSAGS